MDLPGDSERNLMQVDYLIVGSGLTGAVIARLLADAGREVMVVDRREHAGGNVHDHLHPCGVRIHTYGPHYFRTSSDRIWEFVTRFSPFYKYEAALKSHVDGAYENWPVGISYIRRAIGEHWKPEFSGKPRNFEEACLAMMPRLIYEKFVRGYTEKQWGVPARSLSASLAGRFDIRMDDEPRLKLSRYQGIPLSGYSDWMTRMLEGIEVRLGFDYLKDRESITPGKLLVFTGPIDEFFSYALGRLAYRGQQRDHVYHPQAKLVLPCGQVNNPSADEGAHIRTLEWKHMLDAGEAAGVRGTVLTTETPFTPLDPNQFEYPFPDEQNQLLYRRYREVADKLNGVLICGRLGEYRYYDMDQAIGRAMMLAERITAAECLMDANQKVREAVEQIREIARKAPGKPAGAGTAGEAGKV